MFERLFRNNAVASILLMAISVFSLGFALISQYGFGLHPCYLCILQRWPYVAVFVLGLLAFMLHKKRVKLSAFFIFCSALALWGGMGVAGFHVGVEQKWWEGTTACKTPDFLMEGSIEDVMRRINEAPAVSCGDIPWSLFGISMAGYNFILSFFYGLYALLASIFIVRKANGF